VIEPLRLSFDVACGATHAFATWTQRASAWWPREHTMAQAAVQEIVFEPRVGGRIFERTGAGHENEWGKVTAWEPPHRIAYLWHIATVPAEGTDVEIRFVALGPDATRVEIEHGGWDRLGPARGQAWRNENQGGWDGTLPAYMAACAAATSG
jgi:hypothetical protein